MYMPLEYSMSLWWVATPQWGSEPDPDFVAPLIDAIDTTVDLLMQENAPCAPAAPTLPVPVPLRRVVTGYTWAAEPHWDAVYGPICKGLEATRRHDAARRRDDRVRHLAEPALRPPERAGATLRGADRIVGTRA